MSAQVGGAVHLQDSSQEAIETIGITTEADQGHPHHQYDQHDQVLNYYGSAGGTSEIEEENSGELFEIGRVGGSPMGAIREDQTEAISLFSFDIHNNSVWEGGDCVYVAVGAKGETSMDALMWTLKNAVADRSNTTVFLVHVFPETRFIPSALGNLPISGVSEQQVEMFKAQERGKRSQQLQKYLNACISSKAILELIPVLNITKLVVGTAKSNLRRLKSKKGNGIADQVLQKAPEMCEVKIICEGKEVVLEETAMESPSTPSHSKPATPSQGYPDELKPMEEGNQLVDYFSCICFKPKAA
ncbi:hypothetical protein BT93_F0696 [Corymbia citriodora subsp. variegata]|nr:hypothetical protein BT93_F0696 [Corymbia citriodora subsp. variegata]